MKNLFLMFFCRGYLLCLRRERVVRVRWKIPKGGDDDIAADIERVLQCEFSISPSTPSTRVYVNGIVDNSIAGNFSSSLIESSHFLDFTIGKCSLATRVYADECVFSTFLNRFSLRSFLLRLTFKHCWVRTYLLRTWKKKVLS